MSKNKLKSTFGNKCGEKVSLEKAKEQLEARKLRLSQKIKEPKMTDFESLMHDISDKAFTVLNAKMED